MKRKVVGYPFPFFGFHLLNLGQKGFPVLLPRLFTISSFVKSKPFVDLRRRRCISFSLSGLRHDPNAYFSARCRGKCTKRTGRCRSAPFSRCPGKMSAALDYSKCLWLHQYVPGKRKSPDTPCLWTGHMCGKTSVLCLFKWWRKILRCIKHFYISI
jgi:hypothetical protein